MSGMVPVAAAWMILVLRSPNAKLVRSFEAIPQRLGRYAIACQFLELLDRSTPERQPQPERGQLELVSRRSMKPERDLVEPEGLLPIHVTGGKKNRGRYTERTQHRKSMRVVVAVAVVKGHHHRARRQRPARERGDHASISAPELLLGAEALHRHRVRERLSRQRHAQTLTVRGD